MEQVVQNNSKIDIAPKRVPDFVEGSYPNPIVKEAAAATAVIDPILSEISESFCVLSAELSRLIIMKKVVQNNLKIDIAEKRLAGLVEKSYLTPTVNEAPTAAATAGKAAEVEAKAATTIQAIFRGHQAKKAATAGKAAAATTIQAIFRGHQAKKAATAGKAAAATATGFKSSLQALLDEGYLGEQGDLAAEEDAATHKKGGGDVPVLKELFSFHADKDEKSTVGASMVADLCAKFDELNRGEGIDEFEKAVESYMTNIYGKKYKIKKKITNSCVRQLLDIYKSLIRAPYMYGASLNIESVFFQKDEALTLFKKLANRKMLLARAHNKGEQQIVEVELEDPSKVRGNKGGSGVKSIQVYQQQVAILTDDFFVSAFKEIFSSLGRGIMNVSKRKDFSGKGVQEYVQFTDINILKRINVLNPHITHTMQEK